MDIKTKICNGCGEKKPLDAFYRLKGGKHGRNPKCKTCISAYLRERYKRNREKILQRAIEYRQKNREYVTQYRRKYREAHKEEYRKYRQRSRSRWLKKVEKFLSNVEGSWTIKEISHQADVPFYEIMTAVNKLPKTLQCKVRLTGDVGDVETQCGISKGELAQLLKEGFSYRDIGNMFDLSRTTVMNLKRLYGL